MKLNIQIQVLFYYWFNDTKNAQITKTITKLLCHEFEN